MDTCLHQELVRDSTFLVCASCGFVVGLDHTPWETANDTTDSFDPHTLPTSIRREVDRMAGEMCLCDTIRNEAYRVLCIVCYKRVHRPTLAGAIYIACRNTGFPRTEHEIVSAIPHVSSRDLFRAIRRLEDRGGYLVQTPREYQPMDMFPRLVAGFAAAIRGDEEIPPNQTIIAAMGPIFRERYLPLWKDRRISLYTAIGKCMYDAIADLSGSTPSPVVKRVIQSVSGVSSF
jgi:hypothetical protein